MIFKIESASTGTVDTPRTPVSSSVVDLDGAVIVGSGIAWSFTSAASTPVDLN